MRRSWDQMQPKCLRHNLRLPFIVYITGIMITSLWLLVTPESLFGKLDAIGYAVCHQIASHSFWIGGRPMPLCARCSAMYLGAIFGIVYQMFLGKRSGGFSGRSIAILVPVGILFMIDGINSMLGLFLKQSPLYEPQSWLRVVTGMGMGLLISAIIFPLFTQTAWQTWDEKSALGSYASIMGFLLGGLIMSIGLLTGWSAALILLAILSVLGVVVLLSLTHSVILLMLFKQENRYNRFVQMTPVLLGGMVLMMVQISLFDLVRFLLTRTWEGLPL